MVGPNETTDKYISILTFLSGYILKENSSWETDQIRNISVSKFHTNPATIGGRIVNGTNINTNMGGYNHGISPEISASNPGTSRVVR
jgi:hypothetical protein